MLGCQRWTSPVSCISSLQYVGLSACPALEVSRHSVSESRNNTAVSFDRVFWRWWNLLHRCIQQRLKSGRHWRYLLFGIEDDVERVNTELLNVTRYVLSHDGWLLTYSSYVQFSHNIQMKPFRDLLLPRHVRVGSRWSFRHDSSSWLAWFLACW